MRDVLRVIEDWTEARDKLSYSALSYSDMRDVLSIIEDWTEARDKLSYSELPYFDMRDVLSVIEDWPEARDKVTYSALPYFDMRGIFSLYDAIIVKGNSMINLLYFAHLGWFDEVILMKDKFGLDWQESRDN
ncbi:hypothetical protein ACJMK2_000164 [Sinanodonta woodiana]|uniref:Uncharacterized protein n=1 Tax=Sinanodonta woodiana TaxID=1069815 RepID=A0ABD3XQ82_SINWO